MARIPAEELERLKRETDLVALVSSRGVKLERHGADLSGLCPFHDDHEPSLVVSPARNVWHCLGACQAGGSVVDWVMKAEGVSFRHAVELLRQGADLAAPRETRGGRPRSAPGAASEAPRSTVRRLPPPVDRDAEDGELLEQVVDYYHQTSKESPEALEYLKSRGLEHPELVDRFRIGYANRTLGLRLPTKSRLAGAELRGRLTKLGFFRESGHEHFNGCVVFPIFDANGQVVELYGRKIVQSLKADIARHLYLPGPRRGVFNLVGLEGTKEVILCEAVIDALTFWCAGFRHVTASYGVGGFTAEHLAAFQAHGIERVLIAYDRDDAGDRAAEKLAKELAVVGIGAYRVLFPKGLDANEYARKVQPAAKSLELVVRHARWMGEDAGPAVVLGVGANTETEARDEKRKAAIRGKTFEDDVETPGELDDAVTVSADASTPALSLASSPETVFPLAAAPAQPAPGALEPGTATARPHSVEVPSEVRSEEVLLTLGERRYRVRGLERNLSYEQLRVNLLVSSGERFHVDTLDLYSARQRSAYGKAAAEELAVEEAIVKHDLGRVLRKLEELQDAQIRKALVPASPAVEMTAEERTEALSLLEDPRLFDRILEDFEACGVVGEASNKLVGYLVAVSRKLDDPLAVIVQSSTAAGKSWLMDSVLSFVPSEDRVAYSAMTGQSLFYMGEKDLKHKVLAVAEEHGAERASYALKLLQSDGELSIASTGKDPHSGRLVTHDYRVEGPAAIFLTTTAIEIDEELLNRCLVLTVDEDREQTRAIHRRQREAQTLEGLLARHECDEILAKHRNAQRLLRPLEVVNPFARKLTFLDDRTRMRRDHLKYLGLIRAIALLFQHQRPKKTAMRKGKPIEYVEVTLADLAIANRLANEVLGRSLDELPPQTRKLLGLLEQAIAAECERSKIERSALFFSTRDVRRWTGWGQTQVKVHLARLVELEYVLVHRGGRGQSFVYELLYAGEGQDGERFLPGLLDVEALAASFRYDTNRSGSGTRWSGPSGEWSGVGRPPIGGWSGGGRTPPNGSGAKQDVGLILFVEEEPEKTLLGREEKEAVVAQDGSRTDVFPLVASLSGGAAVREPRGAPAPR